MKKPLWNFIDETGTFRSEAADKFKSLYFPLCNSAPFMSSVSPDLHGDIKTGFNNFLLEPVTRLSLSNSRSSRNFWIYTGDKLAWSATGVSKDLPALKKDKFSLEAGLLWHKITRENKKIGLKAQITSFVPASGETAEIMLVEITNTSSREVKFIPTAAIPVFARSLNNLHDHRHVTSLLNRIVKTRSGIIVTPALLFDETGHRKNFTSYFVFGADGNSNPPVHIFPTQEEFCSEASDLEAPKAVLDNTIPDNKSNIQGKEAMAGLRFKEKTLRPKGSYSYIIVAGIADKKEKIAALFGKFNSPEKAEKSFSSTKEFWQKKSSSIRLSSRDTVFDNWFRWVSVQPLLRKIFGCSFLPDFDYGRGGRGWRDLWQDCLSLIFVSPGEVKPLLINNFRGVRVDGSNATIIGQKSGEFIADRNSISRVWMDHGAWPLLTAYFYMHQSGDTGFLLEEIPYFRDHQLCRGRESDAGWTADYGKEHKTISDRVYKGTLLEHILVQNLVQFFNVGPHNHIRLENADWNDGLDLAGQNGESVAFSAMYAHNLNILCAILERLERKDIYLMEELKIMLDTLSSHPINYSGIEQKRKLLNKYFDRVKNRVSGKKIAFNAADLQADLKKKADWLTGHIRETEWLTQGFFNGYYDNDKQRVEGTAGAEVRMTLTGQVFPIMSGIATGSQVKSIFANTKRYLKDRKIGGFRLNSDFKKEQLKLGRAFSFAYGEKENGAFFNHMAVMFAYSLYSRGFAKEGFEVINSLYRMSVNTQVSKIYPCLPEYFNSEGRGMYSYLTGSASWFILTLLTQVFGIRGEYGDLTIEPKLTREQFKDNKNLLSINTAFAGRPLLVVFSNRKMLDYGEYSISQVRCNGRVIATGGSWKKFSLARGKFLRLCNAGSNKIEIILS